MSDPMSMALSKLIFKSPMQQHFKHYYVTIKASSLYSCCLLSVIGPLSLLADRVDRRMNQKKLIAAMNTTLRWSGTTVNEMLWAGTHIVQYFVSRPLYLTSS